ncbi:hypothetical protein EMCRGX_G028690 [Ephydatia muelleri]
MAVDGDRIIPEANQQTSWLPIGIVGPKLVLISPLHLRLDHHKWACSAKAAARATEQRKHDENDAKCKELGWICVPMVAEAYGAWGTEAMKSFSLLASRLATSSNRAKAEVLAALYGRLNLN